MVDAKVKEILLASRKAAEAHIARIRTAPELTYELLDRELVEYIKSKFHLTDSDCTTDHFETLSEISLSKSMAISRELVAEFDLARSCDGVSSVRAKMVLLYMAIQKELGVTLPPEETAYVDSVHDISKMVWKAMGHGPVAE